jgi:hypothetical protein
MNKDQIPQLVRELISQVVTEIPKAASFDFIQEGGFPILIATAGDSVLRFNQVTEAFSGPLVRGEADTDLRPYKFYYDSDVMNHLTARSGRIWSGSSYANTGSGVYINGRNTTWQYDADGRLTDSGETQ